MIQFLDKIEATIIDTVSLDYTQLISYFQLRINNSFCECYTSFVKMLDQVFISLSNCQEETKTNQICNEYQPK